MRPADAVALNRAWAESVFAETPAALIDDCPGSLVIEYRRVAK